MSSRQSMPLELLATSIAGLTAGGTLYITLCEAPTRATLPPAQQLIHWRQCFTPAKNLFKPSGLLLVPILCTTAYKSNDPKYYVAASMFGSLAPWTAFTMSSVNSRLLEMEGGEGEQEEIVQLVEKWAKRHAVRVVACAAGFGACLYALASPAKQ